MKKLTNRRPVPSKNIVGAFHKPVFLSLDSFLRQNIGLGVSSAVALRISEITIGRGAVTCGKIQDYQTPRTSFMLQIDMINNQRQIMVLEGEQSHTDWP